jgi:hypothetical protein
MSKAIRLQQFDQLFDAFIAQAPEDFFVGAPSYTDYDGPSLTESQSNLQFVLATLRSLRISGSFLRLPFQTIINLQSHLQNVHNLWTQLKSTRDQVSYQNYASALDQFAAQIRMGGLPLLEVGASELEATRVALDKELDRLRLNSESVETLRGEVTKLIGPAIAGSLSQEFSNRRDSLSRTRMIWGIVAVVFAAGGALATYEVVNAIGDAISKLQSTPNVNSGVLWASALVRTAVILPLFAAFGFAFSQYKKERDFEEEYAHKAAVATSLPNYGDLTRDATVRDQIVTAATDVIFSSPTPKRLDTAKAEDTMKGISGVLDSAAKLVRRQG